MITEKQFDDFRYKMRDIMKAYDKVHRHHYTCDIYNTLFQEYYRKLLRLEDEAESMYKELTGKECPVNFIVEVNEHMLLESWCKKILNYE